MVSSQQMTSSLELLVERQRRNGKPISFMRLGKQEPVLFIEIVMLEIPPLSQTRVGRRALEMKKLDEKSLLVEANDLEGPPMLCRLLLLLLLFSTTPGYSSEASVGFPA